MVSTIFSILLIILLFFLGHIVQALKKVFGLITKVLLKILNFFGIKIQKKEKSLKLSKEFKETYKEIRVVKISKNNIKQKSSVDYIGLITLIIAGILVVVNLASVSGNAISNWIYSWSNGFFGFIKTATDMNVMYTAVLFSVLSFSVSRILNRWKETKQQRKEAKEAKIKKQAIELMSSKELVDEAKKKDDKKEEELK